jgi:tetratricopeptide (TPR) repeat protein
LLLEKLQQVYQDISHHIDYENNAEWYNLKREIEVKLEKWDEALLSTEKAYQDDNNLESYLRHKYEIYLQIKDYHKAIDVLEQMIKNFPPPVVNPSDIFETNIPDSSYAHKLELLFITEQYDKYTQRSVQSL